MSDFIEELEIERRIDRIADQFEAAFRDGQKPDIEGLLSEVPKAWQTRLFRELLAVEVELRQDRGEQPQRDEYERRFPGRGEDIAVAFRMADDNQDSNRTLRGVSVKILISQRRSTRRRRTRPWRHPPLTLVPLLK